MTRKANVIVAGVLLVMVLATSVRAPALRCEVRRFGNSRPTCVCRGEGGRWRAWPMAACRWPFEVGGSR